MASPAEQADPPERQRRIRFKDYGRWRANLLLWGVPLAVVVLLLAGTFTSGTTMSIAGIPFNVTCEGWAADAGNQCAAWARDVVDSAGEPQREVTELQLKKSWYGIGDQCTAVFVFEGGGTAESEFPCP